MKKMIIISSLLLITSTLLANGFHRKSRINAAVGLSDQLSAHSSVSSMGNVQHSFGGNGASTSLGLGMHIDEGLWGDFNIQARAMTAETEIDWHGVNNHHVAIIPVMIGLRYYPFYDKDTSFQPFAFIQGGPVICAEEKSSVYTDVTSEAHTETAMGYQYGGGVNLLITDWLSFDASGGYLRMNELKNPINGATRFNGWNLSFGLSLYWGWH